MQAGGLGAVLDAAGVFLVPVCDDLGFSRSEISLYLTFYFIATVFAMPIVGKWITKYNLNRVLSVSFALVVAAVAAMGMYSEPWQWWISGVVFGLAGGLMETYASDPGSVATPTFTATLLLLALFCAGSLQVVGFSARRSGSDGEVSRLLVGVYRLALLLMMAGYLFMPVLEPYGVPGDSIVLAGYLGLSAVLVSLFVLMAKLTGMDAALSFSRGFAALYLGEAGGLALGNALQIVSPSGDIPFAVASCAGFSTLFAYLFLFTEGDFLALSRIAKQADRFGDACRVMAAKFKLSKRESEILPLALRGRTGERMAAELFIAKSTVDTHLRRIYAKCGVHSRQELIDLGELESQALLSGKES